MRKNGMVFRFLKLVYYFVVVMDDVVESLFLLFLLMILILQLLIVIFCVDEYSVIQKLKRVRQKRCVLVVSCDIVIQLRVMFICMEIIYFFCCFKNKGLIWFISGDYRKLRE